MTRRWLLWLALAAAAPAAIGQGCSQCRESVGQTPAPQQRAYRRAIATMVLAAAAIFTAGAVVARRFR